MDYTGDRLSNFSVSSNDRQAQQAKADRYRPGTVVTAYYNPENPSESVIERVAETPLFMLGFFSLFAIIGALMLIWILRSMFVRDTLTERSFFNQTLKSSLPSEVKSLAFFFSVDRTWLCRSGDLAARPLLYFAAFRGDGDLRVI